MGPAREEGKLTEAEAIAGLAFAAVCSDGVLAAEEDAELVDLLADLPHFFGDERAIRAAISRAERLARSGEGALLRAAGAAIAPPLRATAYAVVGKLLHADEALGDEERAFLERVRVALGLDLAAAKRALEG